MKGTILLRADGTVHRPGCLPERWTVLDLTPSAVVIHTPAGGYSNRGWNPTQASIDVYPIERLSIGENGGLVLRVGSAVASYHPTGTIARPRAVARIAASRERLLAAAHGAT